MCACPTAETSGSNSFSCEGCRFSRFMGCMCSVFVDLLDRLEIDFALLMDDAYFIPSGRSYYDEYPSR